MTTQQIESGFQLVGNIPEGYERYLVPVLHEPWARQLVDLVSPRPGERVLDVACGTGITARYAAERVGPRGHVTGLDRGEGMLAVARGVSSGIQPPVEWRHGDATDLPFPDGAFDAVVCQQALQFFSDRPAALREMRRVLAPEGRLALTVWRSLALHPVWAALDEVVRRHTADENASPFPDVDAATWRDLLVRAGFANVRLRIGVGSARFPEPAEFLRRLGVSSPLADTLAGLDDAAYEALVSDLRQRLAEHTDDEGVVFAMQTYLLDARR